MTCLVLEHPDELAIALSRLEPVFDETTQSPLPQSRVPVLLDDVEVRVVRTSSRFPHLADDRVDTLREGVLEYGETPFTAHEIGVRSEVKHIHDELGHGISSDPEEDVLSVLDQEESMAFEPFGREWQRMREDDTGVRDCTALMRTIAVSKGSAMKSRGSDSLLSACCGENRRQDEGMGSRVEKVESSGGLGRRLVRPKGSSCCVVEQSKEYGGMLVPLGSDIERSRRGFVHF